MIKKESNSDFSVEKMCKTLQVSRSGFYDWGGRGLSERQREDEKILEVLTKKHTETQGMSGLNKLYKDVIEAGFTCGRDRVYRLQKANHLYSVRKKPFRVGITDSNHSLPKAPNLLNQNFKVNTPNTVLVTDYYPNGNKKSVTYPDGSSEHYTYFDDNLLQTLVNKRANESVMDNYSYTYDGAHNQITKSEIINRVNKGTTEYV